MQYLALYLQARAGAVRERLRVRILNLHVAAGWNELDARSFLRIATLLRKHAAAGLEARAAIAWHLLGLRWYRPRRVAAFWLAFSAQERHSLLAIADPFLSPQGLTRTPLPRLRCGWRSLHAVHADLLAHLDAETWGVADAWFMRYNASGDPQHLRRMAALLYAPKGMPRHQRMAGAHLHRLERCSLAQLLAVHTLWSGHRHHLQQVAPWVFRKGQRKAARRSGGWDAVLRSMAGGKFGPYQDTRLVPARTFLAELSDEVEREQRRREKLNQGRRALGL